MKKKVLIVDDEVAFTKIAKLILEDEDQYEVCVENDSRHVITAARKFWPDIIVLDVVMPGLDGGEVHNQLKADPILKSIPIIFLTAIVRQKEVDEHQGIIGGSFYLAKPVSGPDLKQAIDERIRVQASAEIAHRGLQA